MGKQGKNRAKSTKISDELLQYMSAFDMDDLADGAWQAVLEDSVDFYNAKNGTNFDSHDAFMAYCDRNSAF